MVEQSAVIENAMMSVIGNLLSDISSLCHIPGRTPTPTRPEA